ncbi:MAG TPA: hypothetical protein VN369_08260 [Terriglobales bacterium]|nr:hypothetical protein [Terriglobales bacterium]
MPDIRPASQNGKDKASIDKSPGSWVFKTVVMTLVISFSLSLFASTVLLGVNIYLALTLLLFFVLINIGFDIVGTAVTAAIGPPFHSMAARRVPGAAEALWLIGNADKVANVCNDVVGDISGIISGTATAVIISAFFAGSGVLAPTLMTAFVAALTVGGKALGKGFAIKKSNDIVFFVARVIHAFKRVFGMNDK